MSQGKSVGRILFRVDPGYGIGLAKLVQWKVTSIKRAPRRRTAWLKIPPKGENTGPVLVYLRPTGDSGKPRCFRLDDWPGDWAASPTQAWKNAVPVLEELIAKEERDMAEAKTDCCGEDIMAEYQHSLRLLRSSLTSAKKHSIASKKMRQP